MPAHNNGDLDATAEHAVVVRLLEDHAESVTRDELYATRSDINSERLDAAILSLAAAEVVSTEGDHIRSAPALIRLDDLRLIAI
jgi:hypothetical protein